MTWGFGLDIQMHRKLFPFWGSYNTWEIILMDLIMQLPESNSYNAICVIIDRLTKRAHFISINNQFSSKDIA